MLGAIGMSRSARFCGLVLLVAPIAVGGAVVAVVGAVFASPAMPIGLARRAEPDPGFFVDGWVVSLGFVAVAAVVVGSAALSGWPLARGRRTPRGPTAPSVATAAALRLGAGPVAATGVRLAFDRRPPSLPVRSALGGVTVAVVGMTAVLIFSASLDRAGDLSRSVGVPVGPDAELHVHRTSIVLLTRSLVTTRWPRLPGGTLGSPTSTARASERSGSRRSRRGRLLAPLG